MLMLAQNFGEFCTVKSTWPHFTKFFQRGNPNLAEGDPLPIFLKSFYNNEVGKEAPEAVQDPSPRWIVREKKFC